MPVDSQSLCARVEMLNQDTLFGLMLQLHQHVAGLHGRALIDRHLGDGSVVRGQDFVLHLHGFQEKKDFALLDALAGSHLNLADYTGDWGAYGILITRGSPLRRFLRGRRLGSGSRHWGDGGDSRGRSGNSYGLRSRRSDGSNGPDLLGLPDLFDFDFEYLIVYFDFETTHGFLLLWSPENHFEASNCLSLLVCPDLYPELA